MRTRLGGGSVDRVARREFKKQVSGLLWAAAGHDDRGLERGKNPAGRSGPALARRTTHRQFTRRLLRADWERRKGPRLPDQGLCEPKIIWTCAPQLLSIRIHSCLVGAV